MNSSSIIDWRLAFSLGLPALVAVVGWFFAHRLQAARDRAAKKREIRVRALESAYLRLASSSNRPLSDAVMKEIEMFVSEIQLYGTPHQIQLMGVLVEEYKKPNNRVSYDELLSDLRDSLRRELNLEPVKGQVWWLRFKPEAESDRSNP